MTSKEPEWVISVCGLNCAKCDIQLAGHGNETLRSEIVDWFKDERNEIVEPGKIRCEGCLGPSGAHWSADCPIMLCAKDKGLSHCFQCKDFPCVKVEKFGSDGVSHHQRTIENSMRMKKIGIAKWIEEQNEKERCEFCP